MIVGICRKIIIPQFRSNCISVSLQQEDWPFHKWVIQRCLPLNVGYPWHFSIKLGNSFIKMPLQPTPTYGCTQFHRDPCESSYVSNAKTIVIVCKNTCNELSVLETTWWFQNKAALLFINRSYIHNPVLFRFCQIGRQSKGTWISVTTQPLVEQFGGRLLNACGIISDG